MDVPLFEQVAEAVHSLAPGELGVLRSRAHRRGVKVWFGPEKPTRQHFEAQLVPRRFIDGADGVAVEIGFHAEHRDVKLNEALIEDLRRHEKKWRRKVGVEAEIGVFLGAEDWRRVSETWIEPDLDDPELAFELAATLVDYVTAIEPIVSPDGPVT